MDNAFAPLALARAYRVSEIWRPRDQEGHGPGHRGRAQRAALTAAYHAGVSGPGDGTVAFGWIRTEAGGPVHVLTVGEALAGTAGAQGGEVLLSLPGGARGTALRREELSWLTAQIRCWREVAGISDALLAGGRGRPGRAGCSGVSRPGSGGSLSWRGGPMPGTRRGWRGCCARRLTLRGCPTR